MKSKKFLILGVIGIMVIFAALLWRFLQPPQKTVSFTIPPKGQYRVGEIFPVKLTILTQKNPINAVQADIKFSPQDIEIVAISTQDSFATVFLQKEIDNNQGIARLTGGLPNPGWSGDTGEFGTLYVKAKRPGLISIDFLPSSLVLANDGKGTNLLKDLPSISYLILPEKLSAKETAQQREHLIDTSVLGEGTRRGQLTFYDETDNMTGSVRNKQ